MKADEKGVSLTSDLSSLEDTFINHDEQRIQQVILNLQSNALKFTENGSITIKADITSEGQDSYLEVLVVDTGIGIESH